MKYNFLAIGNCPKARSGRGHPSEREQLVRRYGVDPFVQHSTRGKGRIDRHKAQIQKYIRQALGDSLGFLPVWKRGVQNHKSYPGYLRKMGTMSTGLLFWIRLPETRLKAEMYLDGRLNSSAN